MYTFYFLLFGNLQLNLNVRLLEMHTTITASTFTRCHSMACAVGLCGHSEVADCYRDSTANQRLAVVINSGPDCAVVHSSLKAHSHHAP